MVTDIIKVCAGDLLKSVKVYSVSGQLLQSFMPDDNQVVLNLSHLTPGVYIIEARTHSVTQAIKQIIKR